MHLLFRCLLLIGVLSVTTLSAQTLTTGSIAGRVTDSATSLPLGGARVMVSGTSLETYTSSGGDYVLLNVPAGAQSLVISYVGYPNERAAATVTAGQTARADAAFGTGAIEMDRFVIEGSLVGTARAINQQRAASTLTNIVAADEIGNFADQNVAESLQRIPGLSLYRDQGEGRYIVLRGLNYNYTNVKVNGASFAGANLGERATALDVIPTDMLASIEVTKVPTPDLDGEGLGGQVNVRTKSPFDNPGLHVSFDAQGQYASLDEIGSQKFNATLSTTSADGRWGFLIAPTWQEREFGSHNFETGDWREATGPNGQKALILEELEFREYEILRTRYGTAGAIEFKPDVDSLFYLRGTYNRFTDAELRHLSLIPFVEGTAVTALSDTSATVTGIRRYARRLRIREKDQEVIALTLGGEKRVSNWLVEGHLGFTEGEERRPDELVARFRRNTRDQAFTYSFSNPYSFTLGQVAGASLNDPANYNFQRMDLANESGEESELDAAIDLRRDLDTVNPAYVKFGARFRSKEKSSEVEVSELAGAPASFTFASVAGGVSNYPYHKVPVIDADKVKQAFYGNRAAFTGVRLFEDSETDDWVSNEDVTAAYAMGSMTFGATNVIAGLRVERTEFDSTGKELNLANETSRLTKASSSYTNWLPGLYLRRDLNSNLVLRASWSNSLARPNFSDTAFRTRINEDDGEIFIGNPGLETLESTNWDASVEYYLPSLGMVSASVFLKQIENFSYEITIPGGDPIASRGYDLTTFRNGSDGDIRGLELAYQQQLQFLPAPLDGFGVLANITFADSEAEYPTRPGEEVPFIGQSDRVANLGLTYEKAGFFARLALNIRSERLREDEALGGDVLEDFWVDDFEQLDLSLRYRLSPQWTVYADLVNLTDEPFLVYRKTGNKPNRLGQLEEYGWSANFGVKFDL